MKIENDVEGNIIFNDINSEDDFRVTMVFNNSFKGNPFRRKVVIEKNKGGRELFIRPDKKLISSANEQGHFWIHVIESNS